MRAEGDCASLVFFFFFSIQGEVLAQQSIEVMWFQGHTIVTEQLPELKHLRKSETQNFQLTEHYFIMQLQ